jgi:hypothetical protein
MVPSSLFGNDRTTLSWGNKQHAGKHGSALSARETAGKRKHETSDGLFCSVRQTAGGTNLF